jgi:hypothetical protein
MARDLSYIANSDQRTKEYSLISMPHGGKKQRLMEHIVNRREWNMHLAPNMERKLKVCILFQPQNLCCHGHSKKQHLHGKIK